LQYAYDAVGHLVSLTYPDGKLVSYEYDAADRLARVTEYAYDGNGRLISVLRPNGTQMSRSYDDVGQLLQQQDVSQFDFSYDAAGNISQEMTTPEPEYFFVEPVEMTYSAANRLATGPLSGSQANLSPKL